ncbi:MAG: YARHG domain-containing protein [Clostridia bacterium]|nr:YARHG domain-containing protein [Clostridia bacterium]
MNCPKCNAQNDDNAQVCIECGEPLDTEETTLEDKNALLEELKLKRLRKKRNKQRKKIIIICLAAAIILGAAGYGIYRLGGGFIDRTDADSNIVISTATPKPTQEATPSPEPTPEVTAEPTIEPTEEPVVIAPVATEKPLSAATAKPVKTSKPKATVKPVTAPAVSSPGFVAGSVIQPEIPQGNPITSTLVSVTGIETAAFSGKPIAKFSIGNKPYYAYADNVSFDKGVPAMYSIDAVATADVYYGQPVYSITKISSYAADAYILPQSSEKILTEADLAGLTKTQLELARNEIFARHGRVFKRQELQRYFESKTWYKKSSSYNYTNDYLNLSDTELKNAKFILAYENK